MSAPALSGENRPNFPRNIPHGIMYDMIITCDVSSLSVSLSLSQSLGGISYLSVCLCLSICLCLSVVSFLLYNEKRYAMVAACSFFPRFTVSFATGNTSSVHR